MFSKPEKTKGKTKKIGLFCLMTLFTGASLMAQPLPYRIGTSRVSTEPDSTILSVALSGYGYPPEGRFSIEWMPVRSNTPTTLTALTGSGDNAYGVDDKGDLWKGSLKESRIEWQPLKQAGTAKSHATTHGVVHSLAAYAELLYGLTDSGVLLSYRLKGKQAHWQQIKAPRLASIAVLNNHLYATTASKRLTSLDLSHKSVKWADLGAADDLQTLTALGSSLYGVNLNDTLWHISPENTGVPWMEVGRYNGITYDIHVDQIATIGKRVYAYSKKHQLFIARHSTDGHLSATAMAIEKEGKTVVLMGVDLTGFDYTLTDAVKDSIFKKRHLPKSAIVINASHTHFPPSAQAYPTWPPFLQHPDSTYLNQILKTAMVKAIEEALDARKPANLYFGRGSTNIGYNRCSPDPETPHDRTLDVLEARDAKGKVTGVLFSAGCHAVFNNEGKEGYTLSGNFPAVTRQLIREKTGADAVFIQGCAGDINPRNGNHTQTGQELADNIFSVLKDSMTKVTGDISYSFHHFNIPVKPWSVAKINEFKVENSKAPDDVVAQKNVRWADLMLNRYKQGTVADTLPEYVQILNIGNWKFVGLSREAVNEYGPAIRRLWPQKDVSVAGYCNDVSSYLPKAWHVKDQTYEGYDSFFWYGQSGLPPVNIFDIVLQNIGSFRK